MYVCILFILSYLVSQSINTRLRTPDFQEALAGRLAFGLFKGEGEKNMHLLQRRQSCTSEFSTYMYSLTHSPPRFRTMILLLERRQYWFHEYSPQSLCGTRNPAKKGNQHRMARTNAQLLVFAHGTGKDRCSVSLLARHTGPGSIEK